MSKDGGPAFPSQYTLPENCGMSLRDWFAAAALPGLQGRDWSHMTGRDAEILETWAKSSYAIADEMLKARES
jgi:hypothetical protein